MRLYELTAFELHQLMKDREVSPIEVLDSIMAHVRDAEPTIRAYITICDDTARESAHRAEEMYRDGSASPLTGIPVAIKDNMCAEGIRTTCGSKILHNFVPPYDATVVSKLKQAGAPLLGKTNMDEFAMGSSCENSGFFPTYNPWKKGTVPGGSSGGSAATVAALGAPLALGSDTGGSVRQPASMCGVVGLKPTYGRVSRYGLVAFASSLDQIGPLSKDVRDSALLLNTISGHDPLDSTSAPMDTPDFTSFLGKGVSGMKIGVPREYFGEGISDGVRDAVSKAIAKFEELGAQVGECSLPNTEYAVAAYYLIAPAECSSNLAKFDGVRHGLRAEGRSLEDMMSRTRQQGFSAEVKRRILIGTYALSAGYFEAYYGRAQRVRTLIKQDFKRAFQDFDVIVSPTSPTVAFKAGERTDDPLSMYLADIFTIPVNLAGLPGISIPCGFSEGLPVGLQLIAPHFEEGRLFTAAHAYEQATNWRQFQPVLS